MLLNDFFKIKNIEGTEKFNISIEMNSKHKIYEGHFPGNPIAPGVCLTQMVKETLEYITKQKLTMVTGDNIKFTAILNPEVNGNVSMSLDYSIKENGFYQTESKIFAGETNFFSFKGSFRIN